MVLTNLVKSASGVQYINLAAVNLPLASAPTPFGNFGRNPGIGPAYYNTDLALNKTFGASHEGLKVQFRTEVYNLFNHTNFVSPTSSGISGSGTALTGGTISSTFPARIMQFGLKINY